MIGRAVGRVWSAVICPWVVGTSAAATAALAIASTLIDQVPLRTPAAAADLRAGLPGLSAPHDLLHSALFLGSALVLSAGLILGAVDLLLPPRSGEVAPGPTRHAGRRRCALAGFRVALAVLMLTILGQLFVAREVTVPVAPQEIALLPTLDATIRASETGWMPDQGLLGTIEVAPRLAGGELAGPFGEQDRAVDAPLAHDAATVSLRPDEPATAHGLRLAIGADPPGWAVRVRLTWQGVEATSPFLQGGQSWEAAALPLASPAVVAIDRVLPEFDPGVPITQQRVSGAATAPAVVVTLHEGGEVVGSRALEPGGQAVLGEFVLLVEGFAPVLEVTVGRGWAWGAAAAGAAAAAVLSGCLVATMAVMERRRRG